MPQKKALNECENKEKAYLFGLRQIKALPPVRVVSEAQPRATKAQVPSGTPVITSTKTEKRKK